ncbi:MAG: DUF6314 family protein, partial [Pseudomonadota bacterium]
MGTSHLHDAPAGPSSIWSFAGDWTLQRRIDHSDGRVDHLSGTCRFERAGPRLIQDELGWLETSTGRFQATRRYVWTEAGGRLDVFFDDMRPFHAIPLGEVRPETVHLCPPDRYHVAYDFSSWPEWRTVWSVEGPRKTYRMSSHFAPDS